MLRVSNIKISIDEDKSKILKLVLNKLKIKENELIKYHIFKESIDARKKGKIDFVYTVDVELKNEQKLLKKGLKDVVEVKQPHYVGVQHGSNKIKNRPVVVGSGPAGLFAALLLAQRGYNPLLIERGLDVDERTKDINNFWNNRVLYSHKPHVGTDILKNVVKNIREEIKRLGGEVRFNTQVTDIEVENDSIKAVIVNYKERVECDDVIFAVGHSARDSYEMLYSKGVKIIQKPFAIGARIEHPQELINKSQYKEFYNHPRLGAADYRLIEHTSNGRTAYSFCMCPGGTVIASASNEFEVVTNGMSEHARDKVNANSAFLVNVTPEDFGNDHPLAGIEFQKKYEKLAYELGGKNYNAPMQLVGDFLSNKTTTDIGRVEPSYKPGVTGADLRDCLPEFVTNTMKEALISLDRKLNGFAMHDAVLTGVETRSSAPVRIVRDEETLQSVSTKNLYPCGEGAGYAGGIVTAAVDGIKCAEKIIEKYCPIVK